MVAQVSEMLVAEHLIMVLQWLNSPQADVLIPRNYPLSRSPSKVPILHVYNSGTRLHCRPAELYLGASTFNQQLSFFVFWDQNVFDREVVSEWLEDVRSAAEFYLGNKRRQPHL